MHYQNQRSGGDSRFPPEIPGPDMKIIQSQTGRMLIILFLLLAGTASVSVTASASSDTSDQIWSEAADPSSSFVWTPQTFEGFYYNYSTGFGTEEIAVSVSKNREIKAGDLEYTTTADDVSFAYEDWGGCSVIAWLGTPYVASLSGYDAKSRSYTASFADDDFSFLSEGVLPEILADSAETVTLRKNEKLKLGNNYTLIAEDIDKDNDEVVLSLKKNSKEADSQTISSDEDFIYTADVGRVKDVPVIVVRVGSISSNRVEIEGIFQISDDPETIKEGRKSNRLKITALDDDMIVMTNPEKISLKSQQTIDLTENYRIIVSDSENLAFTLRCLDGARYINELNVSNAALRPASQDRFIGKLSDEEIFEKAGTVSDDSVRQDVWTGLSFPGFYYNAGPVEDDDGKDSDVNPEKLSIDDMTSDAVPKGKMTYSADTFSVPFSYGSWGSFRMIMIGGVPYLAGYTGSDTTNRSSARNVSPFVKDDIGLIPEGFVCPILIDIAETGICTPGNEIDLGDDYAVIIGMISGNGSNNTIDIRLLQNGTPVFSEEVGPDSNFVYETKIGNVSVPVIALHIRDITGSGKEGNVTIDGCFRISENVFDVSPGTETDNMKVSGAGKSSVLFENTKEIPLDGGTSHLIGSYSFCSIESDELCFFPYVSGSAEDESDIITTFQALNITKKDLPDDGQENTGNTGADTGAQDGSAENEIRILLPDQIFLNDKVTVTVTDKNGWFLADAVIRCEGTEIGRTDESGALILLASPAGSYNLTASKETYEDGKAVLTVQENGPALQAVSGTDASDTTAGKTLSEKIRGFFNRNTTSAPPENETPTGSETASSAPAALTGPAVLPGASPENPAGSNEAGHLPERATIYGALSVVMVMSSFLILVGLYVMTKTGRINIL